MNSLYDTYKKILIDKITVCEEDLTQNELLLIKTSFEIFNDRLSDIKTLQDEVSRLTIENLNIKSYNDNTDYEEED